jgi:hypothetical protein
VHFGLKATRKPLGIEHAFAKCGRSAGLPAAAAAEVRTALAKSSAFITMDSFGAPSANACFSQIFYQIQFHCIPVRRLQRKINALFVCCRRSADNL